MYSYHLLYDFPENRRSPVPDAIQENHPGKRLVLSFLYALTIHIQNPYSNIQEKISLSRTRTNEKSPIPTSMVTSFKCLCLLRSYRRDTTAVMGPLCFQESHLSHPFLEPSFATILHNALLYFIHIQGLSHVPCISFIQSWYKRRRLNKHIDCKHYYATLLHMEEDFGYPD